jgi:hypothetical protein
VITGNATEQTNREETIAVFELEKNTVEKEGGV